MSLLSTSHCCLLPCHCAPLKSIQICLLHESPTPSGSGRQHLGFTPVFSFECWSSPAPLTLMHMPAAPLSWPYESPLYWTCFFNISVRLWDPKMNTVFQMWPHDCQEGNSDNFPWPTSPTARYAVSICCRKGAVLNRVLTSCRPGAPGHFLQGSVGRDQTSF